MIGGAVHPLDLSVGPGVLDAREPVLDAVFLAAHVEHVGEGCRSVGEGGRKVNWMP